LPLHKQLETIRDSLRARSLHLSNSESTAALETLQKFLEQVEYQKSVIGSSLLFNSEYYVNQLGDNRESVDPMCHFLLWGWRQGLNPSPFFDTKYYLRKNPHLLENSICPLIDFLTGWKLHLKKPNVLFDTKYYCQSVAPEALAGSDPVTHYLTRDAMFHSPHPLFDAEYYLRLNSDVCASGINPWEHFVRYGQAEGRQPHPLFDSKFYEAEAFEITNEYNSLFEHFVEEGGNLGLSPCKQFDSRQYKEVFPNCTGNPLEHFQLEIKKGGLTHAQSLAAIFADSSDIAYESDGRKKLPVSAVLFSSNLSLEAKLSTWKSSVKPIMIFFGHEATRTGAPLILLELVRHFSNAGYECVVILAQGGPIVKDYAEFAAVQVLVDLIPFVAQTRKCIDALAPFIAQGRVRGALINTGTIAGLYDELKERGVHTVTLIHEFMDGFSNEHMQMLYRSTDEIVFPSKFIRDLCNQTLAFSGQPIHVKAQGLLKENFGNADKPQARLELRQKLNLPQDAFIVLGVGSLDLRKGFDFFLAAARKFSSQDESERPVFFVWLGAGKAAYFSLHYFANWDVQQSGLEDVVRIVPNSPENELFFAGSDVFFMCSRQDPFPCVVQESLASALPVVSFSGSGGAQEMLQNGGGIICPYGDVDSVGEAIKQYLYDEQKRAAHGAAGKTVAEKMDFGNYFEYIHGLFSKSNSSYAENNLEGEFPATPHIHAGSAVSL